ncbi:tetratricopeptide repeat protein [Sphingobacterium sp. UT-1RO-CII-1]|uniref:tetratricopeptide repeat protein n=1 Tax=Sphingobacterium sp. UT-1RO-CII-1 TaxID=2995225 RepID=UPI00227AED58|nr:tetratricopeptide repeat protein [Sphingobacterium sp. UT-1RO-CII-1]MCY4781185.1 tetratricopeptide repeat protein [Sphingobacterium sp. UT-1RO-CII-1]
MILKENNSGNYYIKHLITGVFSVLLTIGYAQEQEKQQKDTRQGSEQHAGQAPVMESIDVVRDYRPMLADAVKVRRSPEMDINRQAIDMELRYIAAATYFERNRFKQAYNDELLKRHPNASRNNIDNYRISYLAYGAGEYPRATSILEKVETSDAYYQGSLITLGHIALETGNKQRARDFFVKAMKLNLDPLLKEDAVFNYAKTLQELDSTSAALDVLQQYLSKKYVGRTPGDKKPESAEELSIEVLLGTSNFHAGVSLLESLNNRGRQSDMTYQRATYYRGLEFYNERAFENSISMFMRSEKFPIDAEMAALATYWKAEAMYEVRKYKEAVENFSQFLSLPVARRTDVYSFAHYALAYAAFRSNSFNMAAEYFERFLASEGKSLEASVRYDVIARLGDSYLSVRNYGQAKRHYEELIKSKAPNQDYAFFQRGIIQGLQGDNEAKISTLSSVVKQFPNSNYADDVAFEIPYTYFTMGDYDTAIEGLQQMVKRYPRSSYVPRALMTIGLVQYNKGDAEAAKASFQKIVEEYATTDEAAQALRSIENIYIDEGDATGYIHYALGANLKNLSPAEQDNLIFQTAYSLFGKRQYGPAVEAVNAYFDKFPKARQEKHARYIRGVSLYHTGHPQEALHDLNIILNDWTSKYTENTLLTAVALYMDLGQYNEAIVHLKKLEINSEFKDNYSFALTNLMVCYYEIGDFDQVAKYVQLIKNSARSSEEDIAKAHLYSARALLKEGNKTSAMKEFNAATMKSQLAVGAEARYRMAQLQYDNKQYDKAQETAFDVVNNMEEQDYWVARSFILLADTYSAKGNKLQAKSTLESVIENYDEDDDIIPAAKERLKKLNMK